MVRHLNRGFFALLFLGRRRTKTAFAMTRKGNLVPINLCLTGFNAELALHNQSSAVSKVH
jgi:hypothetical protein